MVSVISSAFGGAHTGCLIYRCIDTETKEQSPHVPAGRTEKQTESKSATHNSHPPQEVLKGVFMLI